MSNPEQCPHYNSCTANVCPMDERWRLRNHLKGEQVCTFVRGAPIPDDLPIKLAELQARIAAIKAAHARVRWEAENHPYTRPTTRFSDFAEGVDACTPEATTPASLPDSSRPTTLNSSEATP